METAIALTVKSRRARSPSRVSPNATTGLRLCWAYASERKVVTSMTQLVSPSRTLAPMVPNSRPIVHTVGVNRRSSASTSSGRAEVVKSRSCCSRPSRASRTLPPTR